MSVVFSSFTNANKNKNGYFRIGNVTLNIPPSDIITDRIINNDRKQVLRGKNEMFTKSGQARWDVTITWLALIDNSKANPYEDWEKVQTVVAMFKAAPFVEVENNHLRQIFAANDAIMASSRLAFGLRQLKIETHPDITDALNITLTMTYFNYQPYSLDFGYIGSNNGAVDAYNSNLFSDYLDTWKANNLVNKDDSFHASAWKDQITREESKISLNWKRYKTVTIAPKGAVTTTETNSLAPTTSNSTNPGGPISPANLALIQTLNSGAEQAVISWLTDVNNNGYSYTVTSALRTLAQQTTLYNTFISQGGVTKLGQPGGPKYLVAKPGFSKHETGDAIDIKFSSNAAFNYAYKIAGSYGMAWTYGNRDSVHWDYTGEKTPIKTSPQLISISKITNSSGVQTNQSLDALTDIGPEMQDLINNGWTFDYLIEDTAFFFKPEEIILRDELHKHLPHAKGLHPTQIAVLFVNNLAQIPLANYQYPTYQHIGPAASLVSIQMTSVGTAGVDNEPQHEGLTQLTTMSHILEEQYLSLRSVSRSVKSIHGMQAVFIENAILNMIGIFGVLPEQISTEIIKDSSNMAQVTMTVHQYENMYEEIDPYKVNGITGSYITTLKKIVDSGSLNSISSNEKSQLTEVMQFQKDYDSLDPIALGKWISTAATLASNGNFIGNLIDNPTINLSSSQATNLASVFTAFGTKYPCLANRTNTINSIKSITYVDYVSAKYLASQGIRTSISFVLADLDSTVNNQLSNVSTYIKSIYIQIIPFISNADSIFASQLQKLVGSPAYKSQFQKGVSAASPSSLNPGHGAYKDLGLGDLINPDQYFVDHQDEYKKQVFAQLGSTATSISNNANSVSGLNSTNNTSTTGTTGIPTDPNKLIQMLHIPGYSMKEAFPTFKLFFMEDSNAGIYYLFDNFYSYSSVLEIEVVRPWDKPSTAIIRLTNISNLFDHKLFDDTLVGRHEEKLYTFSTKAPTSTSEPTTNSQGSVQVASKNPLTGAITGRDIREGYDPANPKLIPLKYFPLQTGSKIQVRMGFDNDPDKLTPVFNGMITEIVQGDQDELIITAQSFLIELSTVSGISATNSYWDIGGFLSFGSQGPAYGGMGVFKDNGDAQTVIKQLLSNPAARHFGHWQLNGAAPDKLMKGYSAWQSLSGSVATTLGYTNAAAIINNAYDRSGENIMINNYVDYTGALKVGRGVRAFKDQANQNVIGSIFAPYSYYVANDLDMSIWELIRDVSRRYPEYLLLEKFYGFPYEADSTLVFGSPLDWYYTRPSLIGDDEILRSADSNNALYQQWWASQGKIALTNALELINQITGHLTGLRSALSSIGASNFGTINIDNASKSYADLQLVNTQIVKDSDTSFIALFATASSRSDLNSVESALAEVNKSYLAYVSQNTNNGALTNADRIKPIRRYHFIDHQSIVHNSIKLNDKIYNVIKITAKGHSPGIIKANSNIPEHHVRLLDVTSRINDPERNVADKGGDFYKLIGQSFLKEEVGKMYRGEIILRGIPEIEPMDILILMDPSTGIVGPVEVDQVIHSFTQEMGYVTIIKPRVLIVVNETAGAALSRQFGIAMATVINDITGNTINSQVSLSTTSQAASATGQTNPISGLISLVFAGAFSYWANAKYADNPLIIQPLFRFNRPWVGGLEGFDITGLQGTFSNAFEQLKADEIYPLLDLYKIANKITS